MTNDQNAALRVFIVEDEALIAWDMTEIVEESGDEVVGEVASLDQVRTNGALADADVAFVDVQLKGPGNGLDVCQFIRGHHEDVKVFFVTANVGRLSDDLDGAFGVIEKPITRDGFKAALSFIKQGVRNPPPRMPPPRCLRPADELIAKWGMAGQQG
ncbi:MAG: response regulator [Inquilinaceae bacterium]